MRADARVMKAAGGGSIVNISSIGAVLTARWAAAYCCSKAGVNMLTRCTADDFGVYGIRVNAVMPGLVPTEITARLTSDQDTVEEYLRLMPLNRVGSPEDVSAIVAFLLSDEASWITGQCIGVDGGHTLRKGPNLEPIMRQIIPEER